MEASNLTVSFTVKRRPIACRLCYGLGYALCWLAAPFVSDDTLDRIIMWSAEFIQKHGYKIEVHSHG